VAEVIAAHGRHETLDAGEILLLEGDPSTDVFLCVSGQIRIFVSLTSGRDLVLGTKDPGQEFGELAAIDQLPRSAGASAVGPTVVAKMSVDEFVEEVLHQPELAVAVLRGLARQIRRATAGLSARNSDTAAARAGQTILELAGILSMPGESPVELPITQGELADRIGATRESTARALGEFRRSGVLETGRGRIIVHDLDGLETMVRAI
jgi:CRP-like cAMP-binding protein